MKKVFQLFIAILFLFFWSCDKEDDFIHSNENTKEQASYFNNLMYPVKVIQNFSFELTGLAFGEVYKVSVYHGDTHISTVNTHNNQFVCSLNLSELNGNIISLKGLDDNNTVKTDTSFQVQLIKQKETSFNENIKTNKLGLWIWYLEETGFSSHSELAQKISDTGVKRAFIKVADGRSIWPEAKNTANGSNERFLNFYQSKNMEVYAWSYNYPDHEEEQALALYEAAKSGFDGFIIDIESEFDGNPEAVDRLLFAFYEQMMKAIYEGLITEKFPLLVTTWGNPKDHSMAVDVIDRYVDAHMPQTYIEKWGGSWLENPENTIDVGNTEYRSMGAKKPIFHIISAENTGTTAIKTDILNRAIQHAGPNASIWKIPGSNMGSGWNKNWTIIEAVSWSYNYE